MVCGTYTVSGVAQDDLQRRMNIWRATKPPPTSVTAEQDDDGTYTITAVFPPCPDDTTHSPGGSAG